VISCGYPGDPVSISGFQLCTKCSMTSSTNFCDAAKDVVNTGTPCFTAAGHSGGAIRFQSSPLVVRGTLSRGTDEWDMWSPFDQAHYEFLFSTTTPRTLWAETYAYQPAGRTVRWAATVAQVSRCIGTSKMQRKAGNRTVTYQAATVTPCNTTSDVVTFTKASKSSLQLQMTVPGSPVRCLTMQTSLLVVLSPCLPASTPAAGLRRQWWFQDRMGRIRPYLDPGKCVQPMNLEMNSLVLRNCVSSAITQKWSYR